MALFKWSSYEHVFHLRVSNRFRHALHRSSCYSLPIQSLSSIRPVQTFQTLDQRFQFHRFSTTTQEHEKGIYGKSESHEKHENHDQNDQNDKNHASVQTSDDSRLHTSREAMHYDVVIVGAGPAGLSAAIRLKQNAKEKNMEVSVCVVEKGSEVGAHILSGNVFEPRALDELLPGWRERDDVPIKTKVVNDKFVFLTDERYVEAPIIPPDMHNDGNFIISLSELTQWLAKEAETMGVEIYAGFSAAEVLIEEGAVVGIATSDVGIGKDGRPTAEFARGMELRAAQTFLAEGCRGSCSEIVMEKYNLRAECDPQTYGLGLKEVWEIEPDFVRPDMKGTVIHTVGWPNPEDTYAGSFLYFIEDNKILLGMVVGLDYTNPYLNPYEEFQKWKTHPFISQYLKGGTCTAYGARALNEGGFQSIPKLHFPGGALIGCSAGFLNVPKIKGTHTAMKSGILAADSLFDALLSCSLQTTTPQVGVSVSASDDALAENPTTFSTLMKREVFEYGDAFKESWVYAELYRVRNYHPSFHKLGNLYAFVVYCTLEAFIFRGKAPWTFQNSKEDYEKTMPASQCRKIEYPKPDGVLTFDILTNLQRSGTYHEENQPSHLQVRPDKRDVPVNVSYATYAAPETRFCPAKVYEFHTDENGSNPRLQINSQNCLHCKTCSIKTPEKYINWTVPQGGGGPAYQGTGM